MGDKQAVKSPARRSFFKKAGIGIGAAGAAAVGLSGTDAPAAEPAKSAKAGAYRETEHVKQAYRTARF